MYPYANKVNCVYLLAKSIFSLWANSSGFVNLHWLTVQWCQVQNRSTVWRLMVYNDSYLTVDVIIPPYANTVNCAVLLVKRIGQFALGQQFRYCKPHGLAVMHCARVNCRRLPSVKVDFAQGTSVFYK